MGSLNVMVIILVFATTALFAGFVLVMVGGVVSVELLHVKLVVETVVRLFPAKSIMLFAGMVSVYFIPWIHAFGDVMVNMLLDMVFVMVWAVLVLVFIIEMLL